MASGNQVVTILGVDVFAALADPVRRSLLRSMAGGSGPRGRPRRGSHDLAPGGQQAPAAARRGGAGDRHRPGSGASLRAHPGGLSPVVDLLGELGDPQADAGGRRVGLVPDQALDALDTEVRRTTRERRPTGQARPHPRARGDRMTVEPTGRITHEDGRRVLTHHPRVQGADRGRLGLGDRVRATGAVDRHLDRRPGVWPGRLRDDRRGCDGARGDGDPRVRPSARAAGDLARRRGAVAPRPACSRSATGSRP